MAAKKLAECMDYPWEFMPEEGRERMRVNAAKIALPLARVSPEFLARIGE